MAAEIELWLITVDLGEIISRTGQGGLDNFIPLGSEISI